MSEKSPQENTSDFEYLETQGIAASPPSKKRVLCVAQQLKKSATFENTSASFSRAPPFLSIPEKSPQENTSDIIAGTAPQRNAVFPMDQGKFQRRVLFKLEQLSEEVKSLKDRLDFRLNQVIEADESMSLLKENMNTMDDFNENEIQLAEEPMKRKLIERLSKIGGANIGDCTRTIMRRMLDCFLMRNFNMDGQRGGKRSFKDTNLYKCVIRSVLERYPKESEKTVHQFIQGVLKNAPASRKSD
nr:uncharacterized protein LOC105847074 isoform X2 [Hydra vulgaris]XP_047131948.1 uncharacterized protein LOC105847074 isoform X2 [Hydra vulgaris]